MDGSRFDSLTRSLSVAISRRRAVGGLLSGSLSMLGWGSAPDAAAHDLLPRCKKKSGKQKKKCLKKARAHNATHVTQTPPGCIPNCAGKNCGPDGCGSTCGSCNDGTCTAGTCVCRPGEEVCQGRCVPKCGSLQVRRPGCTCCGGLSASCSPGSHPCCSNRCSSSGFCEGRSVGEVCDFNEQCTYENCTGGICRCPSGTELCTIGSNACALPCPQGQTRIPNSCNCCIESGSPCGTTSTPCCSGGICQQTSKQCIALNTP